LERDLSTNRRFATEHTVCQGEPKLHEPIGVVMDLKRYFIASGFGTFDPRLQILSSCDAAANPAFACHIQCQVDGNPAPICLKGPGPSA
jgi:hypothetical protein